MGQDPSVSKSKWLLIFRFSLNQFETYSANCSKTIGGFHEVLNFNRLFLKVNRFIHNYIDYPN